jgi:transposase
VTRVKSGSPRRLGARPQRPARPGAALYQLDDPQLATAHLDGWLAWAARSRLAPFVKLARTIRRHRAGILAAVRLGLSNGRLEGLNSRIRLISHRSFEFHSATPLIALVYLCCGRVTIGLPR